MLEVQTPFTVTFLSGHKNVEYEAKVLSISSIAIDVVYRVLVAGRNL